MRVKPLFYGWYDAARGVFRVSRYPPDAPVRPSAAFASASDVIEMIERRRARLMWWPPLSEDAMNGKNIGHSRLEG